MGQLVRDDESGEILWQDDNGELHPAERPELMALAGRQFADLGSGIQEAAGRVFDQPDWIAQSQADTRARNQAFYGSDQAYPLRSMVGQAIPSIATAPITGGASVLGQVGTNMALGAAETALDVGEGGTFMQRGMAGAAGGLIGDVGGRILGRVANAAKGLLADMGGRRGAAANPLATQAEEVGLTVLESQRMAPGSPEADMMKRLETGADTSLFSPGLVEGQTEANQKVVRDGVLRAIGLEPEEFTDMGPETFQAAGNRLSDKFSEFTSEVVESGGGAPVTIPEDLAQAILNTQGQVPKLVRRGKLKGLTLDGDKALTGSEWNIARRALSQDASRAAAKGEYELADDMFADVETLDALMAQRLPEGALEEFARLREQYRVFKVLGQSGSVKNEEISTRGFNNRLVQGFGDTARQGLPTNNPETGELINLMRIASNKQLQPYQSSGTAERLSANRAMRAMLDPTQWASLPGEVIAPAAVGVSSMGGGNMVTGGFTPSPSSMRAGGMAGRSLLDEMFYPYVGMDDDRPR